MNEIRKGYELGVKDFCKVMKSFDARIVRDRIVWVIFTDGFGKSLAYGVGHKFGPAELRTKEEITDKFSELVQEALSRCKEVLLEKVTEDETGKGYKQAVEKCYELMKTFTLFAEPDKYSWSIKYKGKKCKKNIPRRAILNEEFLNFLTVLLAEALDVCYEVNLKELDYE